MNQLLNNRVGKAKKPQKRGCLFLLLGSLVALLATGIYIVAVSLLTGVLIRARHGDEAVYALMTLVKGSYVVVLLFFYAVLAIWYISPSQEEVDRQNRQMAMKPGGHNQKPIKAISRRTLWLISGGALLGVVLCGVISLNSYRLIGENGIRTYFFVETDRYEWQDVNAYSVGCDNDNGLSVTFSMRGGKQFEILQGINSATPKFIEKYTSPTHFAAELDKKLMNPTDGSPVPPRNMTSMAYDRAIKFYREDYPEIWPHVSQLIGYVEVNLTPEETVPETEAVSETLAP